MASGEYELRVAMDRATSMRRKRELLHRYNMAVMHASPAMEVIKSFRERSEKEPTQNWGREFVERVRSFMPVVGAAGDRLAHLCLFAGAEEIFYFLLGSEFCDAFGASAAMADDLTPWESRMNFEREGDVGLYTGMTCLHIAIIQGNNRLTHTLLDKFPELALRGLEGVAFKPCRWIKRGEAETWRGWRSLLRGRWGHSNIQVNLMSSFDLGNTTMSLAVCRGDQVLCERVAAAMPDVTLDDMARQQDCAGNTILHKVVQFRKHDVLRWLLTVVSDRRCWEMENNEGLTPLTLAAILGFNDVLHSMLTTSLYCRSINLDFASHVDICCDRLVMSGRGGQGKQPINLLDCSVLAGVENYQGNLLVQEFVKENWRKYGVKAYLKLVLLPFLLVTILAHVLFALRAHEVQRNWLNAWANNCTANVTYRLECARESYSETYGRLSWTKNFSSLSAVDKLGAAVFVYELLATGICSFWCFAFFYLALLTYMRNNLKFCLRSLDWRSSFIVVFPAFLGLGCGVTFLAAFISRLCERETLELDFLRSSAVLLGSLAVFLMVPFRYLGRIVLVVCDVCLDALAPCLTLFLLSALAFSLASFALSVNLFESSVPYSEIVYTLFYVSLGYFDVLGKSSLIAETRTRWIGIILAILFIFLNCLIFLALLVSFMFKAFSNQEQQAQARHSYVQAQILLSLGQHMTLPAKEKLRKIHRIPRAAMGLGMSHNEVIY
ncbi:hypothetical protein GUITHDRAFT_138675 [Guillardia theta CCMP2712]|uniref:Uncharacterized protein n=1 Tax=Guillardia theta (strain CCMP2712) TaxID=905079 RepID=L1JC09_GUITC|nr:hypothetical protein GUITHDRAFT_138675 [Guillardia theta CCMP2712]EKX45817.1 hypothetical protein GUITHDRAFT_138675 [Guillardia theta CCMP2712]|eukprot:XP_005832797.1 hypothetical protein GUITHDRAFT_138675 [Guillardia theta CCMP2712]